MNIKYKKDDQIIEELSFIQSTDFKRNAGIYGIKNALSDSIYGYGNDPFSLNMEEFFLYRVRKNYDENGPVEFFDHTDEIWAPPDIEKIKKGRCNEEYERMLYCSNHPLTCLAEMHFEVGDYFTTIVYKGDEQKKLEKVNFVRIPELIQNDNLLTELLCYYMKNLDRS